MKLTVKELILIRNNLRALRAYKNSPVSVQLWEDWMDGFMQKIEDELEPHDD